MSPSADSECSRPHRDHGGALVDDESVGLVGRMLPAVTEPVDLPAQVGERRQQRRTGDPAVRDDLEIAVQQPPPDRKSTRLNSSHGYISYAVFCLKKKKKNIKLNV